MSQVLHVPVDYARINGSLGSILAGGSGVQGREQTSVTDRFVIKDKLGSGGMGVVYRAFDRDRGVDVALKTLRSFDGDALYRFKKEFRALADIVHPNLVSLHELLSIGDEWFFTMELVEGISFLEHVRPYLHLRSDTSTGERTPGSDESSGGDLTSPTLESSAGQASVSQREALAAADLLADRFVAAVRQLVEAVQAIHQAGKLHRDIKPSNVLVTPDGRVVLCDFGLIAEAREIDRTIEAHTVGSYEEVVRRKSTEEPPPMLNVDERVAPLLRELCIRLLAIDETERPG